MTEFMANSKHVVPKHAIGGLCSQTSRILYTGIIRLIDSYSKLLLHGVSRSADHSHNLQCQSIESVVMLADEIDV